MTVFTRVIERSGVRPSRFATLDHEQRRRARARVQLEDGQTVQVALPRGTVLRDGDVLASDDGELLGIRAADEVLSVVTSKDPHVLARAAYHLGNRHVALQIEPRRLSYPRDHVLDAMLRGLGLEVSEARGPFEPEGGGFGHDHEGRHHE